MNRKRNQTGYFSHEAQGYSEPLRSRSQEIYGSADEFNTDGYSSKPNNPNRTFSYPLSDNDRDVNFNRDSNRRQGYSERDHYDSRQRTSYGNQQWPESREIHGERGDNFAFRNGERSFGYDPNQQSERFRNYSGDSESRSNSHQGKGPKGYQRSDERIREDIHDRLTDDAYVDATEIEVSVSQGEVTLTGSVDDRHAKRRAEDISENISGVRNVENRIRVRSSGSEARDNSSSTRSTDTISRSKRQEKFPVTGIESN